MLTNLRKLREDASVSQKALADAVGVSQQSINKYENHNIEPDIETLILMADYFDTSVDYLIGHSDVSRSTTKANSADLTTEESRIIDAYRRLTPAQKDCVCHIIDTYLC